MSAAPSKLYLSALGVVSPLGANNAQVLKNLLDGSQAGMLKSSSLLMRGDVIVGKVTANLPKIDEKLSLHNCRNNRLLLAALEQIKPQVECVVKKYGKKRIAIVLGSSTSGILEGESALSEFLSTEKFPTDYNYKKQEIGASAEFLSAYLGFENISLTISTACSSSGKVFASAKNYIQSGICDAAIVGGVDSLCKLTVNGFTALESVSSKICNPFSANRDGISIGEGAALFILDKEKSAIELMGVGESSDAHHMSAPHPEGAGAETAMLDALADAQLSPSDIDYVNLHGTATPKNDDMESRAMHRVFDAGILCSSTKPLTGHTLGAAGAIEAAHCWLTLSSLNTKHRLPPHIWDKKQDVNIPTLNLVESGLTAKIRFAMSNSFAFGGNNVSIILGKT
ncbi:3-oxoacyl-[ACP] synthase FabV like [hydrothermal vent metagenome]|uniref:3-oxoacyl-[ACP] synthase FabV like n=1 Tax=hydrothermal vent metagenome TaxID=652676 RepID=A0A3B0X4X6_9ZZZZ